MNVRDVVQAEIGIWQKNPYTRGFKDCAMSVADCWVSLTGKDPVQAWRGLYNDEAGANALIEEYGSLSNIIELGMKEIGFLPLVGTELKTGDFLVVTLNSPLYQTGEEQFCGIYLDPFAAFRSVDGAHRTKRFTLVKAWRCVGP